MYKVIKRFVDLHDENHVYNVGDTYPREGAKPTESRIKELSSNENRQKTPLIEVDDTDNTQAVADNTQAVAVAENGSDNSNAPAVAEGENDEGNLNLSATAQPDNEPDAATVATGKRTTKNK